MKEYLAHLDRLLNILSNHRPNHISAFDVFKEMYGYEADIYHYPDNVQIVIKDNPNEKICLAEFFNQDDKATLMYYEIVSSLHRLKDEGMVMFDTTDKVEITSKGVEQSLKTYVKEYSKTVHDRNLRNLSSYTKLIYLVGGGLAGYLIRHFIPT